MTNKIQASVSPKHNRRQLQNRVDNGTKKRLQNRVDNGEEKMKPNPSSTVQFYRINWGEDSDEEWLPERGRHGAEQMCTTE